MPGFDYSKWDNLELSDDEETFHPNIDNNLMIRINREQRARREAEEAKLKKKYEKSGDVEKLAQLEKNKKLHVDNICTTGESRTIVNSVKPEEEDKIPAKEVENFDETEYHTFLEQNKAVLDEFVHASWEQSRDLMRMHGKILTHDHTHAWLLLGCLNAEMEGRRDDRNRLARQAEILSQLNELSRTTGRPVLTRNVIGRYFDNMIDNEATQKVFQDGVDAFVDRIKNRAVEKKKEEAEREAQAEAEAAELAQNGEDDEEPEKVLLVDAMRKMAKEDRMGPGGLDPVEVFDSLPPALQECFTSGDVDKLVAVAQSMGHEEFEHHFNRCKLSGLWAEG
jgi:cell division cycle protein 37